MLALALTGAQASVVINATNFPDENFLWEVENNWDGVNPFTGFHSLTVDFHDFSRPDVGGLLGANIGIGPHYELHGAYYWGITNGWDNELFNSKSRFYTIGLVYFF